MRKSYAQMNALERIQSEREKLVEDREDYQTKIIANEENIKSLHDMIEKANNLIAQYDDILSQIKKD